MADKMNKIKFNSPVQIPDLVSQKIIAKDLTVQGTMTTENSTSTVIEGAINVLNGAGVVSEGTMMGQVILTGYQAFSADYITFKQSLNMPSKDLIIYGSFNISDIGACTQLYISERHVKVMNIDGTEQIIYEDGIVEWVLSNYKMFSNVTLDSGLTDEASQWLLANADEISGFYTPTFIPREAYAILYDPLEDAIRLGKGYYFENDNYVGTGFSFSDGEGEPIAVRDLSTEDDGALVVWDAANYRLVSAKNNAIKSPLSVELNNIDRTTNFRVEEGIIDIRVDSVNNDARFSVVVDDENDNGGYYVSKSSLDLSANSVAISCKDDMSDEHNSYVSLKYTGAELGGHTITLKPVNGLTINEGTASGKGSIAGGTTDTSFIAAVINGNDELKEKIKEKPGGDIILGLIESGNISASTINTINSWLGTNFSVELPKASAPFSISMGTSNESTEVGTITLGYGNKSSGFSSSAIGSNNIVTGSGSLAYGFNNNITGDFGAAFGQENEVGYSAFAVGVKNTAVEKASVALGNETEAIGKYSHAKNYRTRAEGEASNAQGYRSKAIGNYSDATGYKTTTLGENSSSAGESTNRFTDAGVDGRSTTDEIITAWASKKFSVAKGRSSHVGGKDCLALGDYSFAEGEYTKAKGGHSRSTGLWTEAEGKHSYAGGDSSKALHNDSFVHGRKLSTSTDCQVVFGTNNKDNSNALLIIGNAEVNDTPSNALEVLKDGTVKVSSLECENTIIFNCGTASTVMD